MKQTFSVNYDDIEHKLEVLQKDMEEINSFLNEMKTDLLSIYGKSSSKKTIRSKKKVIVVDDRIKWRREINGQIRILISGGSSFRKRSEVLHYIYNYMRKNYGIVWEQDIREYKERFEIDYKPKTIDVVYDNMTYRSIFEAVLFDIIANSHLI
jgi:hypothetical protein